MRMRSRPEISCLVTVKSGAVSPTSHDRTSSSPMRMNMARKRPDPPRELAPRGRQLVDEDRDEDDVVDPEHQFERGQRDERDPGFGTDEEFEHWAHLTLDGTG